MTDETMPKDEKKGGSVILRDHKRCFFILVDKDHIEPLYCDLPFKTKQVYDISNPTVYQGVIHYDTYSASNISCLLRTSTSLTSQSGLASPGRFPYPSNHGNCIFLLQSDVDLLS